MPRSSASSGGFVIDASGLRDLSRDLNGLSKSLTRTLRKELKLAVAPVAAQAKSNAGWSSRIPKSIRVSATGKGVALVAGGPKAPDAAAYEHNGAAGTFRHPVFGHKDRWVAQGARPFLAPAWQAKSDGVLGEIADAFGRAFLKAGGA